jgi:hypothetical protein
MLDIFSARCMVWNSDARQSRCPCVADLRAPTAQSVDASLEHPGRGHYDRSLNCTVPLLTRVTFPMESVSVGQWL